MLQKQAKVVIQRNECGFGKRNSLRLEEEEVRKDERPGQGVLLSDRSALQNPRLG